MCQCVYLFAALGVGRGREEDAGEAAAEAAVLVTRALPVARRRALHGRREVSVQAAVRFGLGIEWRNEKADEIADWKPWGVTVQGVSGQEVRFIQCNVHQSFGIFVVEA